MSGADQKLKNCILEEIARRGEIVEPWHSYWHYRPARNFPPKSIVFPVEYDGGDRLALACTQTDLPAAQQRKLVRDWCDLLPSLTAVRILWLNSMVTQELFEAASKMDCLEGLYIKWSNIKDLSSIGNLLRLTHLHIGGAPSAGPLTALSCLRNLVDLELHGVRAAADLSFLKQLPPLKALSLAGDGNYLKSMRTPSLEALGAQAQLEKLSLASLTVEDESLEAIANLPRLRCLSISNQFKMEEFANLAGRLPSVDCDLFVPFGKAGPWAQCKKCGESSSMVRLTGKRQPCLCTRCDAQRLGKHVAKFKEIALDSARQAEFLPGGCGARDEPA